MSDKKVLAQLCAEAIQAYDDGATNDALWLISKGLGSEEEQYENFNDMFKNVFGVSFEGATQLNYF